MILKYKIIPGRNILYVVHRENEHIALSFARLVAYYMKENTPFKVIFPQITMNISEKESRVAIAYTGMAHETNDVKLGKLPEIEAASFTHKGCYERLDGVINEMYQEIEASKQYIPQPDEPLRFLYLNSPDDNQPQDLITEIQIPVVKIG